MIYFLLEKTTVLIKSKWLLFYLFLEEKKFIQQAIVYTDLQKKMFSFYSFNFFIPKVKELIALVIKQAINTEKLDKITS